MATQENRRRGDRFGRFRLHERLGKGEMTYAQRATAFDEHGRPGVVAIKRLLPHLAKDEQLARKFIGEAKFVMRLDHPNIAKVYEYGSVDDDAFVSMEYVEGDDLRKILRRANFMEKRPPLQVIISILLKLCRALQYALSCTDEFGYGIRLIRRDISPADVIISTSGEPIIIDFGIARGYRTRQSTRKGSPTGELGYLSPETLSGQYVDARSEIWSMGVLAHELVTAKPLFSSGDDDKTIGSVRDRPIPRPSEFNENCPPQLDAIILRALEREPQKRWQSAGDMADALEALARENNIELSAAAIATWCRELATSPTTASSATQPGLGPGALPSTQGYGAALQPLVTTDFGGPSVAPPSPWDLSIVPPPPSVSAGDERAGTEPPQRSWPSGTVPPRSATEGEVYVSPRSRQVWLTIAITACALAVGYALHSVDFTDTATAPPATPLTTPAVAPTPPKTATLEVVTMPSDATVEIDGEVVAQPWTLEAGTHQLRARHADYVPWNEEITIEPGEHLRLRIALAPKPAPVAEPPPNVAPPVPPSTIPAAIAIGSTRVQRLRGAPLTLPASQRRRRERVRVLICLAPDGRVNSSHILSGLSTRARGRLQAQLARWRYRPIRIEGQGAVSACFTDSLPLD